ncbi:MAG: hypothetical protein M3R65_06970 [Gemmatimonadota bacterium]|nr:hypothetical protein [Gemmatimonadota bacterium]
MKTRLSIIAAVLVPVAVVAQGTSADTTKPAPKAITIPVDFSGVLLGNYQYQGAAGPTKGQNKFELERAYLTFKMPAGDRASIRVTGDVFQQTTSGNDAYYKGWVLRAKYAYLQYDFLKATKPSDFAFTSRIGLIHTMFIDHEENFWPRWLSLTPVERAGYFSSADAGITGIVTLPNKLGELYTAVTNGPGYTSRETDRFKDYQARLTITPLSSSDMTILRTFAIDGWVYRGTLASKYVSGGTGQLGPVNGGLDRNRYGAFLGIRDPRLVIGLDYAQRQDGIDTGLNTAASPRATSDSTGRLVAGYIVAKPFKLIDETSAIPLGIVARYDQVTPNTSAGPKINTFIGGLTWDLNKRSSFSLDYQEVTPASGAPVTPTKTYYMHWVANF